MSQLIVSKRYARALFEAAKEKGIILEVEQDLAAVVQAIKENAFRSFLEHPNISANAKQELLKEAFSGKVADIVLNALLLAVKKNRESILASLYDAYVTYANEELSRAQAVVYSPFELSESETAAIAERFGKLTGKTISIESALKPELVGGIQVKIGDRLYDGSLASKLKQLEKTLTHNAI